MSNTIKDFNDYVNVKKTIESAIKSCELRRPQERSDLARRYSVLITDLEKCLAYHQHYIASVDVPVSAIAGKPLLADRVKL